VFLMWWAMMIGMMLPSALPTILLFSRALRSDSQSHAAVMRVYAFTAGYLAAWTGFSVAATLLQWGMAEAALLSPMMVSASPWLGGAILLIAGIYQWTPLKNRCLDGCRSPLGFLVQYFRPGMTGAFGTGFRHGLYCVGCCWALMATALSVGLASLAWMAVLTAAVFVEQVVPHGALARVPIGVALAAAGLWRLAA
jgi:predicted metal-binding membrane protein